jgi:hypothetical protein
MPAMYEEFESHCPFIYQGSYEALDNLIAVDEMWWFQVRLTHTIRDFFVKSLY